MAPEKKLRKKSQFFNDPEISISARKVYRIFMEKYPFEKLRNMYYINFLIKTYIHINLDYSNWFSILRCIFMHF